MDTRNGKKATAGEWLIEGLEPPMPARSQQERESSARLHAPNAAPNKRQGGEGYTKATRGNHPGSNPRGRGRPVWVPGGGRGRINHRFGGSISNSASKNSWKAGDPCSGSLKLSVPYAQLKQRISEPGKISRDGPGEDYILDRINQESGAYVACPDNNSRQILLIWGTPDQVRAARSLLLNLVDLSSPATFPGRKKEHQFAKITSYSEHKETILNQIERHSTILETLRQKPDASIKFPESMIFLWPTDELPVEISLGPQLEQLDSIRQESGCHIYIDEEMPMYIRVDGYDHDSIIKVVHRLRAKWAELMATMHVKIKLYLVQPPSSQFIRREVDVVRIPQSSGGFVYATPLLFDTPSDHFQQDSVDENDNSVRAKNDNRLQEAVERSLQGLRFLRGHVRMRVNFGTFVLDDYRVPKDSKSRYPFEEFRGMLFHPRTKGHLVPGLKFQLGEKDLLTKCTTASDILAPYEATSTSLEDAEPLYAVNIEFKGQDSSLLRLEAEFAKSPASGLFEVSQKRWIKPQGDEKSGDKRPPLQAAVIDFERSDWQLEIKALEFQEPSSIEQSLRAFSHSIQFSPRESENLQDQGKRRVTFSDVVPVARVVEKTALRYRLKGSNYILEIARYDEYRRVDVLATQSLQFPITTLNQMTDEPITSWGASIFDLQWDNVLGQHANFRVGHTAEWIPSLNTFFPSCDDPNPSDLRVGFNQFISLVKQVALLLGPEQAKTFKNTVLSAREVVQTTSEQTTETKQPDSQSSSGPPPENEKAANKSWANVVQEETPKEPLAST